MSHYEIYDLVTSSDFCKVVVIEGWVMGHPGPDLCMGAGVGMGGYYNKEK